MHSISTHAASQSPTLNLQLTTSFTGSVAVPQSVRSRDLERLTGARRMSKGSTSGLSAVAVAAEPGWMTLLGVGADVSEATGGIRGGTMGLITRSLAKIATNCSNETRSGGKQ